MYDHRITVQEMQFEAKNDGGPWFLVTLFAVLLIPGYCSYWVWSLTNGSCEEEITGAEFTESSAVASAMKTIAAMAPLAIQLLGLLILLIVLGAL
jgi:hypothetical protein